MADRGLAPTLASTSLIAPENGAPNGPQSEVKNDPSGSQPVPKLSWDPR
jgi:hypothetical protein